MQASEPNVPDTHATMKISEEDLAPLAPKTSARKKKKFQFSMKTLMIGMTIAAMLSAAVGWLGPHRSFVIFLTSCQLLVCGGVAIRFALALIRRNKAKNICVRTTVSVLFSAILFIIIGAAFIHFLMLFNHFEPVSNGSNWTRNLLTNWLELVFVSSCMSLAVALFLLIPVLILAAICQAMTSPWNRSDPTVSWKLASLVGMLIGGGTLPLLELLTRGTINSTFVFSFIPGIFGSSISPCILIWADRLDPVESKRQTLPQAVVQEDNPVPGIKGELQEPLS